MEIIAKTVAHKPTALVILDGFGYSPDTFGNATIQANMPTWRMLLEKYPNTLLHASGEYVGLLPGYIGNSEVGHMTIGAGRIVESDLKRIHNAIDSGELEKNTNLNDSFSKLKASGGALHLMGILSDGGVHGHEHHLHFYIKMAKKIGIKKVYIHAFLDGRDVDAKSAAIYLERLENVCKDVGCGQLASLHGRFYAMDRDKNWERTAVSYDILTTTSNPSETDWRAILKKSYAANVTDEYILPTRLLADGVIVPGDGILFFNFRPDRARQLTQAFLDPDFDKFKTHGFNVVANNIPFFVTPTCYSQDFPAWGNLFLFKARIVKHTLLEEISDQLMQRGMDNSLFVIAETEKYAHVTYFFRGMVENKPSNETRILIPSIKAKNYIQYPEMSAEKITQSVVDSLHSKPDSFYLINYANPDMVGHSGNLEATIKACECVDKQVAVLYQEIVINLGGTIFFTADHGNAEAKIKTTTGEELTAHTTNPVPFVLVSKQIAMCERLATKPDPNKIKFGIANIAPTILKSMGLAIPDEMVKEFIF